MAELAPARGELERSGDPGAPAPVVAPPPGSPRFAMLDSLRAVAALAVLVGHVAGAAHITVLYWWGPLLANGDQGVTVFFILSGFLLYRPLIAGQMGGAPRSPWRDYARRRLLRIVPAYWLALTVLAIYPGLPGVFTHRWWYYYLLLQVYNHDISIGGIVVAWSLCVEVSFYLLLPFYAGLLERATRGLSRFVRVRVELAILALLGTGSLVLRYLDSSFPITLPIYMQWFALGLGYSDLKEVLVNRLLGGVMALCLVLPAVLQGDRRGLPRRVMSRPALAWLGLISYGIYLWHLNLLELIAGHISVHGNSGTVAFVVLLIATALAAVAVAAASYYVVERRLLRFKGSRPSR